MGGLRSRTELSQKRLHRLRALQLHLVFICVHRRPAVRHTSDDLGCLPLEDSSIPVDICPAFERHMVSHWKLVVRFSHMNKGHEMFACCHAYIGVHSCRQACRIQRALILAAHTFTLQTDFDAIDAIQNSQVLLLHNSHHQLHRFHESLCSTDFQNQLAEMVDTHMSAACRRNGRQTLPEVVHDCLVDGKAAIAVDLLGNVEQVQAHRCAVLFHSDTNSHH